MSKKRIKYREKKKAGGEDLSPEQILQFMEEEDRPLLLREVLRRTGLEKEQRQRAKALFKDLAKEGRIVRIRGNRYGLPSRMNLVIGRLKCHPDGYGFVIPERREKRISLSAQGISERQCMGIGS